MKEYNHIAKFYLRYTLPGYVPYVFHKKYVDFTIKFHQYTFKASRLQLTKMQSF